MGDGVLIIPDETMYPSPGVPAGGPADTTDPTVRVISNPTLPQAEALATGTVNTVVPAPQLEQPAEASREPRFEQYETEDPDGNTVTVRRDLETGQSEILP